MEAEVVGPLIHCRRHSLSLSLSLSLSFSGKNGKTQLKMKSLSNCVFLLDAGRKDKCCYWTPEEDTMLMQWVEQNGAKEFHLAAEKLQGEECRTMPA